MPKSSLLAVPLVGLVLGLSSTPALSQVELTGIYIQQNYWQSGSTVVPIADSADPTLAALIADTGANGPGGNAKIQFIFNAGAATDFSSVTVSGPGFGTPQPLSAPVATASGDSLLYQSTYTVTNFSSLAALNATYPPGTYTFTATASNPALSQTTPLDYDMNHLPTINGSNAVPALTTASYNALQGLNTNAAFTFNFNAFTGDGITNPGGALNPYTQLGFLQVTPQEPLQNVYSSPLLPDSTTSFTLGADTLLPGTQYVYFVNFDNHVNLNCGSPSTCNNLEFSNYTFGAFTTAAGTAAAPATVALTGGTLAAPTALPTNFGYVGQITGSIGGAPDTSFYRFYWAGGTFEASTAVTGAPAGATYDFELANYLGATLYDITLGASDSGTLDEFLAPGVYEIGLVADSLTVDPDYTLTFETPVEGGPAVPEPTTLALLGLGLTAFGLSWRRRRRTR